MTRVFLSPPEVGDEERRMLLEAFDSNWIAPTGPDIDAFERELAAKTGVAHAVALSSGTAALHLALLLAGVERGDEVLVPSLTFIASAAAVTYLGAHPVFVDCSADSWNLDPALVEEVLTEKAAVGRLPSAVITVDLYGETADYEALGVALPQVRRAADRGLGRGPRRDAPGPGGGLVRRRRDLLVQRQQDHHHERRRDAGDRSAQLAERARHLATQAREPFSHFEHTTVGYNYRLSNLLAALGRAQLRGLDNRIERRKQIDAVYMDGLAGLPGISLMPRTAAGTSNYWLTCILIDPDAFGADRERVRLALEAADIESRPTWKPLHLQPAFSGVRPRGAGALRPGLRPGSVPAHRIGALT